MHPFVHMNPDHAAPKGAAWFSGPMRIIISRKHVNPDKTAPKGAA